VAGASAGVVAARPRFGGVGGGAASARRREEEATAGKKRGGRRGEEEGSEEEPHPPTAGKKRGQRRSRIQSHPAHRLHRVVVPTVDSPLRPLHQPKPSIRVCAHRANHGGSRLTGAAGPPGLPPRCAACWRGPPHGEPCLAHPAAGRLLLLCFRARPTARSGSRRRSYSDTAHRVGRRGLDSAARKSRGSRRRGSEELERRDPMG
jgi:hypothetical protein